jgi:AmiR/NasT family two-component response regulator
MTRILLIDDHEASRLGVSDLLRQSGYEVVAERASGGSVVALAREKNPDVVFLAIGLSDLDGIDGIMVAEEIIRAKPLPVVLISRRHDAKIVERAKSAGVMAYLVNPLRAEQLRPTIELALAHFQQLASLRAENATLKETLEARKIIERAKGLLMEQKKVTEEQAYWLIKKTSMNMRKPMADVAQAILLAGGLLARDKR